MSDVRRTAGVVACLLLLGACVGDGGGSGDPGTSPEEDTTRVDAGGGEDITEPGPDTPGAEDTAPGQDAVEEIGADLPDPPGPPVTFSLSLKPSKDYYKPGDKVILTGIGEDADGTPLDDLPLTSVSVLPVSLATLDGDTVTFQKEGEGKIKAYCEKDTGLSDEVPVTVDTGPPVIEVTAPARAASLHTSTNMHITGSIKDPGGIASASLNSAPLTLGPGGAFDEPLPTTHGLNLIELEATDVAGRTAKHVRSYLYTNKYYPVPEGLSPLAYVPEGIVARLDQDAFVGESGPDFTSLSQMAQDFLLALDLTALIPSPAAGQGIAWCDYEIYLSNLSYDPPQLELWPATGGLDLHVEVSDLSADIWAPAPEFACPDVDGAMTANAVTIDAFAAISLTPSGDLEVELIEIDVQFVGLDLDLYGIAGNIAQALLSFFMDDMTVMIEEQFEAEVEAEFEAQLETLLGHVNIDQDLDVPPFMPGAPGATISIHLRPSKVLTAIWGMEYGMDAAIDGQDPIDAETPGPLARSGCLDGPPADADTEGLHPIEVALHDDVLNQMVFGVWRDGGANTTQDGESLGGMGMDPAEMGVEDLVLQTTALLPPLMTDCHPDGALHMVIGDMRLDLSATILGVPTELVLYLYFSATLDIQIEGSPGDQFVSINYGDMDWAIMYLDEVNEAWEGKESLFGSLLEETFMPSFLDALKSYPYGFAISEIPLDTLLPDLDFTLTPVLDAFERRTGHSLIKAHLVVE